MGGRSANLIGSPTNASGGGYSKQPRANFFMERKSNKSKGHMSAGRDHDKYKRVIPSMMDMDKMGPDSKSRSPLLYIQDHPAVRPDLCRVIICTTFLLASSAFWWLANCCGIIFLYFAASWTCLFFVLLVTSLIGFGLKVRAEEVKDTRREKCERSDASDTSRSIRFKDLLMLRSFRVIKYRECEEALEVAQAVSTLSSRIHQQSAPQLQPTTSQQHHPNCPHHQPSSPSANHNNAGVAAAAPGSPPPPPPTFPPLPANHNTTAAIAPPKHHHNHHHQPLRQQHLRHHHHHHHSKSTVTPPTSSSMHQQHQQQHHRRQASVPVIHPSVAGPQDEGSLISWFSRYQVQRSNGSVGGVVYEDDEGGGGVCGGGGEMMQTLTPNRS